MSDLRYSLRTLVRHPRYAILAVLTLAAGIGATAAVFGLLDALYFRPLPIKDADRLYDVAFEAPNNRFRTFSYEEFRDVERAVPAFAEVFAVGQRGVTLNRSGETHSLLIHYVSGHYFPSLGIPMHLGRGLSEADDRPEATVPQAVVNHQLWTERLGARPDVIGSTIQLNSTLFTVVGVTAPGFAGLQRIVRTDVWVTTAQAPMVVPGLRDELTDRRRRWFNIVGRLAVRSTVEQAQAQLDVIASGWRASDAREYGEARIVTRSQRDNTERERTQGISFLSVVALVLLIACANVANLTLARGEGRHNEIALRSALGASRGRLLRQMLVESAAVVAGGAVLGLLFAAWLVQIFPALLPPGSGHIVLDVRVDSRLLAFSIALAVVATLIVGIIPAMRGSRANMAGGLRGGGRGLGPGGSKLQLRDVLVLGEIALSAVVVIAAGLMVRSLAAGLAVNPGFDTTKPVSTFYVVPGLKGYDQAGTHRFLEEARANVASIAGVDRVSYGIRLPAQGNEAGWAAIFNIPGHEAPAGQPGYELRYTMVGPGYFDVMGTRILRGRGITAADTPGSTPVAVVGQAMARRFWPGEDPLGRHLLMGRSKPIDREIVGIAEDIRIGGLYEPPESYVYVPYAQHRQSFGLLLVESRMDSAALAAAVRQQVARVDANVPILTVSSFDQHMHLLLYEDRRNAWIGIAVALLALMLGAVGVYGVAALATMRRTKELGIRVALGASRQQLLRLLLVKSVTLAVAGASLGIGGGLWVGRLLQSQLRGVEPADLTSLAAGTVVLVFVAIASSFVPAWRASRVDPAVALRDE
jgi:predicted permease